MLLKDHPLQEVTAAVEQASNSGLYSYEVVKNFLCGKSAKKICEFPPVWPNRVDHFDLLVSR
jgi:hypothetical protein